jgi:hypothetical protein
MAFKRQRTPSTTSSSSTQGSLFPSLHHHPDDDDPELASTATSTLSSSALPIRLHPPTNIWMNIISYLPLDMLIGWDAITGVSRQLLYAATHIPALTIVTTLSNDERLTHHASYEEIMMALRKYPSITSITCSLLFPHHYQQLQRHNKLQRITYIDEPSHEEIAQLLTIPTVTHINVRSFEGHDDGSLSKEFYKISALL